jgi:PAS domain S-box-containing protein
VTSVSDNDQLFPTRSSLGHSALWIASIALAYLAAARVSLLVAFEPEGIAAIWPPAGIFLSAMLLTRRSLRSWLAGALCVTGLIAELLAGTPWVVSLVHALALTGDAVLSCWLLVRFVGAPFAFKRVRDVAGWLVLSVVLSNAVTSVVAAAASLLQPGTHSFVSLWFWWATSDGTGNLLVTPLILGWAAWARSGSGAWSRQRALEGAALFILVTVLSLALFGQLAEHNLFVLLLPYGTLPFLLWAAFRLGLRGAATTSFILAVIAVSFAAAGRIPSISFAPGMLDDPIVVQLFLVATAVPTLFVAAVVTERQQAHDSLREATQVSRAIFDSASIGLAQADPCTGQWLRVNRAMCRLTGYSEDELLRLRVPELTHPEDRERDWSAFQDVVRGAFPSHRIEKRYVRKDGTLTWVNVNMIVIRDSDGQPVHTVAAIEDITERKCADEHVRQMLADVEESRQVLLSVVEDQAKTEVALRASEERFSKTFSASPIAMAIVSARDDTYADVSEMFLKRMGWAREEVIGHTSDDLSIFVNPEDRTRLAEAVKAMGQVFGVECDLRTKSGMIRSCVVSTVLVSIGGEPYLLSAILDSTERKQAETAERAATEKLSRRLASGEASRRALLSMLEDQKRAEQEIALLAHAMRSIGECVVITDLDNRILFVNNAFLCTYGFSEDELVGQSIEVVRSDAHPAPPMTEVASATMAGGWQGELVNRRKDGSLLPVFLSSSVVYGSDGQPQALVGIASDITERKAALQALTASEERFRRIIDTANEGIWGTDPDDRTTFVNARLANMLGYDPRELLGRPMADFLYAERRAPSDETAMLRCGGTGAYEQRFRRKDGSALWALVSATPVHDVTDRLAGAVAMLADITDLKHTQDSLMSSVAEKEALLREVHHRVKNNLQGMIHLLQMRLDRIPDPATQVFLRELQEQARTISLVYELLYQADSLAHVDMEHYLRTLGNNIAQAFGHGRLTELQVDCSAVTMDVETATPCGLIVNELVTNALKHAFPPGHETPGRILVRLALDGESYALTVADNGVGMPAVSWHEGPSMGLKLVRLWVTHQLGGTIELESNGGVSWWIRIPIRQRWKEPHV